MYWQESMKLLEAAEIGRVHILFRTFLHKPHQVLSGRSKEGFKKASPVIDLGEGYSSCCRRSTNICLLHPDSSHPISQVEQKPSPVERKATNAVLLQHWWKPTAAKREKKTFFELLLGEEQEYVTGPEL